MRLAHLIIGGLLIGASAQVMAAPLVIAVISSFAAEAIVTALVLEGITALAVQAFVGFAISSILGNALGNDAGAKQDTGMGGSGSFQSEAQGRMQVIRSAVATRKLVYGEVMVSGPLVYAEVGGAGNRYLHMVIPLAPHEVAGIGDVYFNDTLIAASALDASGNVTSGAYSGFARIKKHLGVAGEVADADLIADSAGKWTAAHKLDDCAYLYVRFDYSQSVFPGGIPNIKALVRGKKLYDPRDLATRYSNNWALVMRDYLRLSATSGGLGAASTEIDDTQAIVAANACDERVNLAQTYTNTFTADASADTITFVVTETKVASGDGVRVASSGTLPAGLSAGVTYYAIRQTTTVHQLASSYANALAGTAIDITNAGTGVQTLTHWDQARYTASGTVDTAKRPLDILGDMVSAAAGTITMPQGVFKILPGVYSTPTVTLTASDLRGNPQLTTRVPRRELFNAVRGTYSNPANFWQPSDFPQIANSTYASNDGGDVIVKDLELPYTTDAVRAQRIAKVVLEKSRQGMTVVLPCNMQQSFGLAMWDTVMVTIAQFGWSAKVFRVARWQLAPDGLGVDLTLREDTSASYDWAAGNATIVDPAKDTNLGSAFVVGVPGTPAVTESIYQTTGSAGVKTRATAQWMASADAFVTSYDAQYRPQGATDWFALSPISLLISTKDDLAPGRYDFRVRAINSIGVRSPWSDTTAKELLGLTAPPSDVTGFSVIKTAGIAVAQWNAHPDLDVRIGGRIEIRWSPLTTGATWGNAIIYEVFTGDTVHGIVPLRTGTYMAKAKDSTDNYSVSAVSFVATEGLVTGFSTVGTLTEHAAFTGAKTNVALVGAGIQLDTAGLFDAGIGLFDAATGTFDSYGGLATNGSYAFSTYLDLATSATRRFDSSIQVTQFDAGNFFDTSTGLFDDAPGLFDGALVDDCDATLYIRTTDNNPAGAPVWGAWAPFFVGDFTCRGAQFRLDMVSAAVNHNISITALTVSAKVPV